jgi:hypothetical protein
MMGCGRDAPGCGHRRNQTTNQQHQETKGKTSLAPFPKPINDQPSHHQAKVWAGQRKERRNYCTGVELFVCELCDAPPCSEGGGLGVLGHRGSNVLSWPRELQLDNMALGSRQTRLCLLGGS